MTLSATATAETSTGTVSPKTSPDSITTVNTRVSPSGQGSDWKTDTPYVLFTAPSTCKFARIVIPDTGRNSNSSYQTDSFFLESSSSTNYWIGIGIVNDTNNSEDMILKNHWQNSGYSLHLNSFGQTSQSQYNFHMAFDRGPFDVTCGWYNGTNWNYSKIDGDRFILNPGEKFVGLTGHNSANNYLYANFQAWVYN